MKSSDIKNETIILFEPENLAEMHEFFQNNCEQCTVPTRGDDGKIVAISCGILWTGKNADTHSNFFPREWIRGEQHIPQCTAMQTDQISLLDQPDLLTNETEYEVIPSFALVALLSFAKVTVTVPDVDSWSKEEKEQAYLWAKRTEIKSKTNAIVDIPEKPSFLSQYDGLEMRESA